MSGMLPDDWWTVADVVEYLKSQKRTIRDGTWRVYVSRGQAPQPCRHFGRTPVWKPAVIEEYASRKVTST